MKRSGPPKRRTPLRSRSPRGAVVRRPTKTKYARRERAPAEWFLFVKAQRCFVAVVEACVGFASNMIGRELEATDCLGPVEADHAGRRGIKQKALDRTCIPLCTGHHGERDAFAGTFKRFDQADMRTFLLSAIEHTHELARMAGMEIPNV